MAKLDKMSLEELYARPVTGSSEKIIILKEDFTKVAPNWCEKVCKLKCKNPPLQRILVPDQQVDVLIIQDYSAFDEPIFNKRGSLIEKNNQTVINYLAKKTFNGVGNEKPLTYAITNLLKCQIKPEDLKKGKAPTDTVLAKCRPYLLQEIENRKPKVIISLNTAVTKALGLKKTNYANRGEIFGNVVLTIHPRTLLMLRQNSSGKFWGPDFFRIIERDFYKANALVRGRLKSPDLLAAVEKWKGRIEIARSLEDVARMCKRLVEVGLAGKILSYDTETNTLDPYSPKAKILTGQFGFRDDDGEIRAYVFPLWHRANNFYDPAKAWKFIAEILLDQDIGKIGHNLKFDVLMTATTTGVRIQNCMYDTMLLLHALDSGTQGNLGLKQAVWDYLPETELGGYEDLLPKLHTVAQIKKILEAADRPEKEKKPLKKNAEGKILLSDILSRIQKPGKEELEEEDNEDGDEVIQRQDPTVDIVGEDEERYGAGYKPDRFEPD